MCMMFKLTLLTANSLQRSWELQPAGLLDLGLREQPGLRHQRDADPWLAALLPPRHHDWLLAPLHRDVRVKGTYDGEWWYHINKGAKIVIDRTRLRNDYFTGQPWSDGDEQVERVPLAPHRRPVLPLRVEKVPGTQVRILTTTKYQYYFIILFIQGVQYIPCPIDS